MCLCACHVVRRRLDQGLRARQVAQYVVEPSAHVRSRIHQHDKDVRVPGDIIKESKKTAKPKAAGAKPKAKTAAAATTRPKSTSAAAAATRPAAKKATSTSSTSTAGAKKKQETYVPPAARQRRLPVRARSTARSLRRL